MKNKKAERKLTKKTQKKMFQKALKKLPENIEYGKKKKGPNK